MIKDKTKKKKVNAPPDENSTNQKKDSVQQGEDKKEEINQYDQGMELGG